MQNRREYSTQRLLRSRARAAAYALALLLRDAVDDLVVLQEQMEAAEMEARVVLSQLSSQRRSLGAAVDRDQAEAEIENTIRLHDRVSAAAGLHRELYSKALANWDRVLEKNWKTYSDKVRTYYLSHEKGMDAEV